MLFFFCRRSRQLDQQMSWPVVWSSVELVQQGRSKAGSLVAQKILLYPVEWRRATNSIPGYRKNVMPACRYNAQYIISLNAHWSQVNNGTVATSRICRWGVWMHVHVLNPSQKFIRKGTKKLRSRPYVVFFIIFNNLFLDMWSCKCNCMMLKYIKFKIQTSVTTQFMHLFQFCDCVILQHKFKYLNFKFWVWLYDIAVYLNFKFYRVWPWFMHNIIFRKIFRVWSQHDSCIYFNFKFCRVWLHDLAVYLNF